MNRKLLHSGQVALIMVLIMTVISAVAVSVASRSTVETRIQEMNVERQEILRKRKIEHTHRYSECA